MDGEPFSIEIIPIYISQVKLIGYEDLGDFHLALAAFFAISARFLADSFSALAFPPFNPPRRPRATAAGFLVGVLAGSFLTDVVPAGCPVIACRMSWAITVGSVDGRFFFMRLLYMTA